MAGAAFGEALLPFFVARAAFGEACFPGKLESTMQLAVSCSFLEDADVDDAKSQFSLARDVAFAREVHNRTADGFDPSYIYDQPFGWSVLANGILDAMSQRCH